MHYRSKQICRLLGVLFAALLGVASTHAQPIAIKPQPFHEQCAALKTGTANDDAVTRQLAALKDKAASLRAQAAAQLSQACDSRAIEPLIDALQDEDAHVRIAAITALSKLGDINAVQPLADLTGDKDWRVRLALVSGLASFKTVRARNVVLNGIANPGNPDIKDEDDLRVRAVAILTLNQLKDVQFSRKAILFMHFFLNSPSAPVRSLGEQTMVELKNTRNAASEFGAILKHDHNPELRRWAALWIGKLGMEYNREALQTAAASDADPGVRQTAAEALKQLPAAK
jgi:HEAT repeat protein